MTSPLKVDIITLFPEMFTGVLSSSILGKAKEKGLVNFQLVNFRDYANNKHNQVDDYPYGGGSGMVLKPEPIFSAVESLAPHEKTRVILTCPQGERYSQAKAEEFAQAEHLIILCGHYEGYDERIREHLITDEISIGDYVLTGGELPAMVIVDSVVRLREGALGNEESAKTDSFSTGLLEHPQYTRPAQFREWKVPDVLLSGHHANIEEWRKQQSILRTFRRRPELLEKYPLSAKEKEWLKQQEEETSNEDIEE